MPGNTEHIWWGRLTSLPPEAPVNTGAVAERQLSAMRNRTQQFVWHRMHNPQDDRPRREPTLSDLIEGHLDAAVVF